MPGGRIGGGGRIIHEERKANCRSLARLLAPQHQSARTNLRNVPLLPQMLRLLRFFSWLGAC